jgi:hypothetical protein
VVNDASIGDWSIRIQKWPRDVELRKGLLSSLWIDIPALVSVRDAQVFDDQGAGIPLRNSFADSARPLTGRPWLMMSGSP